MAQEETITIKKETLWKYSTFVLAAVILVGVIIFFTSDRSVTGNVVNNPSAQVPGETQRVEISEADIENAPSLGDADAPVTIVEFSDYECPFCGRHFSQTYPQIKEDYIDTGKVRLVFMDFPLQFHTNAQKAAEAARCAGEQNKYWQMHDKLFQNQQALAVSNLKAYAQQLGLNTGNFNTCLDSGKYSDEIAADLSYGQKIGVQGTPAFFVNGKLVSGAQPYASFQQAINAELDA